MHLAVNQLIDCGLILVSLDHGLLLDFRVLELLLVILILECIGIFSVQLRLRLGLSSFLVPVHDIHGASVQNL